MSFGLTNTLITFQLYIHEVLKNLVNITCIVYMNNILIYSKDSESHVKHVWEVLKRLRKASLYIKLSKCVFSTKEVNSLKYYIRVDNVFINSSRVKIIRE